MRVDTTSFIPGALVCGNRGLGVKGSSIPVDGDQGPGYAYRSLSLPAQANLQICGRLITKPSAGKLVVNEDTSFIFSDAPDGVYFFQWQLLVQGQVTGPVATVVLAVGTFSAYASGLLAELCLAAPSAHVIIGGGSGVSASGVLAPLVLTAPLGHIVPNSTGGVVLSAESIAAIVEAVMVRIKNDSSTLTVSKFLGLK